MDINTLLADFKKSLGDIQEMISVLGQDCKELYDSIQVDGSQMQRRAYVRSVLAFIEGVSHRTRIATAHLGMLLGKITIHELVVLEGLQPEVNDKGEVTAKPYYPAFLNNIKLTYKTFSKSLDSEFKLSLDGQGWQHLRNAVKVRDRLMHPKEITDLEVSDIEIEATKKAFDWFFISLALSGLYAQRAIHDKSPISNEEIKELESRIQRLEADLAKRGN